MQIIENPERKDWKNILKRPLTDIKIIEKDVKKIIEDVRNDDDKALRKFSKLFDKITIKKFIVSEDEIQQADKNISKNLKEAIKIAKYNIEKFHIEQKEEVKIIETTKGVKCWRKSIPIEKVGLYIPGGTAPLFSTLLMLGIPAKLAGCKEIIVCTPPDKDGKINDSILYTAKLTGIKKIFKLGGAQAIAAMAYGTKTIPKVYKIFGPGNQYVTMAKMIVSMNGIAIDMPAGPSEVMVIADKTANPAFIAADLLSQAEHGTDSHAIFISTSKEIIVQVKEEINKQLYSLPRKNIADKSLKNSKIILFNNENDIIDCINEYAPEHLILSVKQPKKMADKVINAGSVFLGNFTPESAGDYASGTNHTLPTNGCAKAYSGVSLDSFVKKITFQEITEVGLQRIGNVIVTMAEAESLFAHKNAVNLRLGNIKSNETKITNK